MELGIEKKRAKRFECVFSGSTIHEENTDMIVPDQSPDILRIVKGSAHAFLKDKNARDGKLDVSGSIRGAVLYIADGEKFVRKIPVSIPFAYVIDGEGITSDSKITAQVTLRSLEVREINPRKISVRASIEVSARAYAELEFELCGKVEEENEYGVCARKNSLTLYYPIAVKEKSFTISDDVELSGTECDMSEIFMGAANLVRSDVKVIGNKAIIKGNAEISYVYSLPDGNLECGEYELPFSQIVDVEGMENDNDLRVELAVSGFEIEPQYDAGGKAHYLTVNIAVDAVVLAYAEESFEIIEDIYSTKYELSADCDEVKCAMLQNRVEKRVSVTETVETGNGVRRVLDASVRLMPITRRHDEGGEVLATDAAISVMYVGEDDATYTATRRTAVVCPLPLDCEHSYEASAEVKSKSFSVGANNEINVRFFTDFEITETKEISVSSIAAISVDTDSCRSDAKSPSVIVKRLDRKCDIWALAKEYSTTVEEIKLANDITDDIELVEGRMVLIPKKR